MYKTVDTIGLCNFYNIISKCVSICGTQEVVGSSPIFSIHETPTIFVGVFYFINKEFTPSLNIT